MMYYIHGYLSSPDSTKAAIFKRELNAKAIRYRDCEPEDLVISDCLKRISDVIKNDENVVLIGSSLGGFLAASIAINHSNIKTLILLNPAIIPPLTNLDVLQGLPMKILRDVVDERLFEWKLSADITILRGTEDDLVPDEWVLEFAKVQEASIIFFHDDHVFSKNLTKLPLIISEILKK